MTKKVAIFGDSISKGIVYEDGKLRRIDDCVVNLIADEYGFEIRNFARYGLTLSKLDKKQTVEKFIDETAEEADNYAVLSIGGNDADYDWKAVAQNPFFDHLPNTPVEEFEVLLQNKVKLLISAGIKVILTTIPPVDSKRYFDNVISKIADGQKVLEFFDGDVTNISRHQEVYNYSIIKVATQNACPIIDLRTGFLLDRKYLRNYCIDGIHPNELGHKFMAEEVVNSLARQGVDLKKYS